MKRMIISPAQLKMINEAATQILTGTSSNAQTVAQDALSKSPGQDVTVDITDATPGAEKKNGFAASTATTNPQQIKNFGKMTFGATNNSSVFEGTKRQVELGRMLEMRRTGKVFSKKQLNEMFMETDIAEKIKDCPAFDVMTTFGSVFGDDAEREMMDLFSAGGNPTDFIVSVYNEASEEDQDLFREKLGI